MDGELLGQDTVVRSLRTAFERDRLPHALLFLGSAGVGRERAAFLTASGLLCDDNRGGPVRVPFGCGVCRPCRTARSGQHPDVHVVMPEALAVARGQVESDAKKKPSADILVDAIRELTLALRLAPYAGKARVAIVLEAQRMNPSAQNALLKTLEEPSAGTTIILVATDRHALLPTVVSRCLQLRFAPLAVETVAVILSRMAVADAEARAASSRGSMQTAHSDADAPPGLAAATQLAAAVAAGPMSEKLELAEALGRERGDVDAIAGLALDLAARQTRTALLAPDASADEVSRAVADGVSMWSTLLQLRAALRQNAAVQLAVEEALLRGRTP